MSAYHKQFINFKNITSKPITAANRHTFKAIEKGNILTHISNRTSNTRIVLQDVLYVPKIRITLVSIPKLNMAEFTA